MYEIRKKEAVRKELKSSPSDSLNNRFKQLRANVKKLIRESRSKFFSSLNTTFQTNPKQFWSIFKLKNKQSSVLNVMSMKNGTESKSNLHIVSTPTATANLFNTYFTSMFNDDNTENILASACLTSPDVDCSHIQLTTDEIITTLLHLDTTKATGPDGIPSRLLKETAWQIGASLTQIFNKSLNVGKIPKEWKLSNIVPIHKKGKKEHVENYRPISILCITSKVLERCILRNIRDHLKNLMDKNQHGFIRGKSCTTQLLEVLDQIGSYLDTNNQTDIIYLDMSKAFDKVNPQLLIFKLKNCFGITGKLLAWFESYLLNRKQRVTVHGATSVERAVLFGVPQGSILGPILFLLYVNDLPAVLKQSQIASFADDTKLFKSIQSPLDTQLLQEDLSSLERWSISSGLKFNQEKCKFLRVTRKSNSIEQQYTLKGKSLEMSEKQKDLGVYINSTLTWSDQTHDQCMKANRMLGFLSRSAANEVDINTRWTLYIALVRSTLGYANQVWSPQSINLVSRIERVQRRATKFVLDLPFQCTETYKERLIFLDLLPISYWHEFLDLMFFYKAISGLVLVSSDVLPEQINLSRVTRSSADSSVLAFRPRKWKTSTFQRSFFIRTPRTYNTLPDELRRKDLSLTLFKSKLLQYYHDAVKNVYDINDARTWKSVCLKCNAPRARKLVQRLMCCF